MIAKPQTPALTLAYRGPQQRGIVLWVTLVAMLLFAAMIAYIHNFSRHVDRQYATQNTADAAAIGAAGEVARGFNRIAMNNVEMARTIAVVQMLDSMPMATRYTLADSEALEDILLRQMSQPVIVPGVPTFNADMQETLVEVQEQIRILRPMANLFNGQLSVDPYTVYPNGKLWQSIEALTNTNQGILNSVQDSLDKTVENSVNIGLGSHNGFGGHVQSQDNGFAFTKLAFSEFRNPVLHGILPDQYDDENFRRGPFDSVFGWREGVYEIETMVGNPSQTRDPFGSPWSGGGSGSGTIVTSRTLIGYKPFGTFQWMNMELARRVGGHDWRDGNLEGRRWEGPLENSQFMTRVGRMAATKINGIWPGTQPRWILLEPDWETDYDKAKQRARSERGKYTFFLRMSYTETKLNGVTTSPPQKIKDWELFRRNGEHLWVPGANKIGDHIWSDGRTITQQIPSGVDNSGNPTFDTLEINETIVFCWAGINFGKRVDIRNPNNGVLASELGATDFDLNNSWSQPALSDLPSTSGTPRYTTPNEVNTPFVFLGYAVEGNSGPAMKSTFRTPHFPNHVAIAQARLFNNHSFDLWTQMWHSQLMPVEDYSTWVSMLRNDPNASQNSDTKNLIEYLDAISPMAPLMSH